MGDKFKFIIESRHFADRGEQENVRRAIRKLLL